MNEMLKARLEAAYNNEINGDNEYKILSEEAANAGEICISKILKDMACEEKHHAKILHDMIWGEDKKW